MVVGKWERIGDHMIGTYLWAVAQVCEEGNTKDAAKVVESTSNRHVGMKE